MKQVFTVCLLVLVSLSACHKSTYTYFAKSSTPVFERKAVAPKPVSTGFTNETLTASVKSANTEVATTEVATTSVSTSVNSVVSKPATPASETVSTQAKSPLQSIIYKKSIHKNSLMTRLVLKKIGKLQAKAVKGKLTPRAEPLSVIAFAASLLAILDILAFKTGILFLLGFLVAIILGFVGLSKINKNPETFNGRGFALTGIILGFLELLLFIIALVALSTFSL